MESALSARLVELADADPLQKTADAVRPFTLNNLGRATLAASRGKFRGHNSNFAGSFRVRLSFPGNLGRVRPSASWSDSAARYGIHATRFRSGFFFFTCSEGSGCWCISWCVMFAYAIPGISKACWSLPYLRKCVGIRLSFLYIDGLSDTVTKISG